MTPEHIPADLRAYSQWVCHDAAKRPINPHTGTKASVADPATWGTFEQACEAFAAGRGAGIGFVFTDSDPFTGIDLDVSEGAAPSPLQNEIYETFRSYAERSPSGRGLHIIIKGRVPAAINDRARGVEVYSTGRYFTVTGNVVRDERPLEMQEALDRLVSRLRPQPEPATAEAPAYVPDVSLVSDEQAIAFVRASEANRRNWDGEGVSDQSKAFGAVVGALALVGCSREQAKRLALASPLVINGPPHSRGSRADKSAWDFDRLWPAAASRGAQERQGQAVGVEHGRQIAAGLTVNGRPALAPVQQAGQVPTSLIIRSMAEVQMAAIEWVWPGWFPYGYLTLVAGETGAAKTTVVADVVSRISTGAPWPNETEWRKPAKVLWLGSEDGIEDMTVPRLTACGADLRNIMEIRGVNRDGVRNTFSMQDDIQAVAALLAQGIENGAPYAAIVIDPITSYLSGRKQREIKLNDAGQLRAVLEPWLDVAQRYKIAIICITHLAKDTNRQMLHRVLGSGAFTHTCRSLIAVVDRKTDERPWAKAMAQVKMNLPDHPGGAWLFETERVQVGVDDKSGKPIHATKPNWDDLDALVDVDNLVASSGVRSEKDLAFALWLSQYFRELPSSEGVEVSKVKEAALAACVITAKQWEKFSPKYLEKKNIVGIWYCRPINTQG